MKFTVVFAVVATCLICGASSPVPGQSADKDWWQWRGPTADGRALESAKPPLTWSDNENVAWKVELPGAGNSTPIVVDGRVYVTAAITTDRPADQAPEKHPESLTEPANRYVDFVLVCFDLESGQRLWQQTAVSAVPHEGHHPTHTYAGASPVSDGQHLFVSFGSYGIYCFDLAGTPQWKRQIGKMRTRRGWGEATSPVVHNGLLIVNWDQEDQSGIYVLDASNGKTVWHQQRDEPTTWATPLVIRRGEQLQVVTNGTNQVRSYDLQSGELIWQSPGTTLNAIPSPVQFGNHVICMAGYRGNAAFSIPLDQTGQISESDGLRWSLMRDTPYVPSPLLSENRLYFTKANKAILTCVDAESGQNLFGPLRLPGLENLYASPIAADGRVYISSREGVTIVIADAERFEVLATNPIDDAIDASPVAVGDRLLLRGKQTLYCFRER